MHALIRYEYLLCKMYNIHRHLEQTQDPPSFVILPNNERHLVKYRQISPIALYSFSFYYTTRTLIL
ncbi:hypothetical protein CW304_11265 [Bacillus sp. UFRGS-B20]|nr:hypothetical protein CW304_11265 [Bacillus sp. UFRGS-B20]